MSILGKIFRIEDAVVYPTYYPCSSYGGGDYNVMHDIFTYNHDLFLYLKDKVKLFESFDTVYNFNYYQCNASIKDYIKVIKNEPMKVNEFEKQLGVDSLFYQLNINDILKKTGLKIFTNNSYYVSDSSISYHGIVD